jgi:hypothetical protein
MHFNSRWLWRSVPNKKKGLALTVVNRSINILHFYLFSKIMPSCTAWCIFSSSSICGL